MTSCAFDMADLPQQQRCQLCRETSVNYVVESDTVSPTKESGVDLRKRRSNDRVDCSNSERFVTDWHQPRETRCERLFGRGSVLGGSAWPSPGGWVARFRAGRSLLSFDTSTVAVGHRSFRAARGARSLLLTERARAAGSQSPDISSALIAAKSALSFSSSWGYAGASSFIASRMIEKVEMWENHLWLAGTTCHGA